MAIIKCKMCGGDLNLMEGVSTAECEFCGSLQTVPKVDDEKKLTLFGRANRLRADCDFDKAAGIYETILGDFPEETEAYWGLVLCKYGIEYVDDPATSKKVPTCRRTLPTSIMEDPEYRETINKADVLSRRVYQAEAEQIDQIQKKILSIVSKEQPYDVFICYKETDDDTLRRTEDSGDAQDLFTELTKDGYRVFFARNTLKAVAAGSEYEPYIYAALNSAKVMLAIGSRAEYFQAVWVKNEWARFLDMMKNRPNKVLIPCYKNVEPYDMPREFRNLQALNMADLTFYSTLKANLERVIPKKKVAKTVVQERVVVGGSGDNKIASLLDRGNMALEDGDWAKADSFFEDVLNNDSKNAQAYLGKTLAQEKCRTIDAFARKRKEVRNVKDFHVRKVPANEEHIQAVAKQYSVPGYLSREQICKMYEFDLSYDTQVPTKVRLYKEEESYWADHKLLSKAEKFATGAVADNLQAEKQALFAYLSDQIKQAEEEETAEREAVEQNYRTHIAKIDEEVEQLCQKRQQDRENDYQKWLQEAKIQSEASAGETAVHQLYLAAQFFDSQKEYKDSVALAQHCNKRIEELEAENARIAEKRRAEEQAEAERRRREAEKAAEAKRLADEKAAAEKKKKIKTTASIIFAIAVACIVAIIIVVTVVIPNRKYNTAVALMESGNYDKAIAAFEEMNGYKDSREQIGNIYCLQGIQEMESGNYEEALDLFEDASRRVDVSEEMDECYYRMARTQMCQWKSGSEWLSQIQAPNVFPDYEDWASLCELHDIMWSVTDDGLESQAEITEFETTLEKIEALIAKLNADIQLPDSYAELSKNIGYYGKYLTETGEYMCMFSDGSGGKYSSAWLSVTAYGFKVSGLGPGVYLKDGELSATHGGNAYYSGDYIYTLLEDGRVEVQEDGKVHYIVPKD